MFTKHEKKLIDMLKNDYVLLMDTYTNTHHLFNGETKQKITYKTVFKFFDLKIIKEIPTMISAYKKYEFIDNYNHININDYHRQLEQLKEELKNTKNIDLLPQIKRIKQIIKEVSK